MINTVTLKFQFTDGELEEFMKANGIKQTAELRDWVFGELCQNLEFGFLTYILVEGRQNE